MPNNANFLAPNSKALPPSYFANLPKYVAPKSVTVQSKIAKPATPTVYKGASSHSVNGVKRTTNK